MKILVNKNTMLKLNKLQNNSNNKKLNFKKESLFGNLFTDPTVEVILDKEKLNNEIQIIDDSNESYYIDYDMLENDLEI